MHQFGPARGKFKMIWFRVRMNSSKMTRVQKAGMLSKDFNGKSKKGTDKKQNKHTHSNIYELKQKAQSNTFKLLWQEQNACVEKKQAMAE